MRRFRWTLRAQMLAWLLLCIGTLATVFASLVWHEQRSFTAMREGGDALVFDVLEQGLEARAKGLAGELAIAVAPGMAGVVPGRLEAQLAERMQHAGLRYVRVVDAAGGLLGERGVVPVPGDDGHLVEARAPVNHRGQVLGEVQLGLSTDEARAAARAWGEATEARFASARESHLQGVLGALAIILVFGLIGLYSMRRYVLEPIRALAHAAAAVEAGRYAEAQHLKAGEDEIGDLSRIFSRMTAAVARQEREIRRIAYTDPLTGLGNRLALGTSLESRLLTLQASSGELALLFIDLDDIKRVNDTLGHPAGDELLVEAAMRIRKACDAMALEGAEIARFGGDEFVVLFPAEATRPCAEALAARILAAIGAPLRVHDRDLVISASIGITVFPDDASSASQLIKNADMAMYQAKAAGKGCFRFYSRTIDEQFERRVRLENDLRGAWERGEMSLAFQPVFDLVDGRVVGAEALLRWAHPELGLVPPSVFIGIAEESGQVEALGHRVLETALRAAAAWPSAPDGRAPFVAVNVSPRQLALGNLPETVEALLAQSGLDPHRLHLELTETAILRDEAQARVAFTRLRALGVGIWLDDFGTGFSGLSHLRRVPVDGVKIDRSFITDLLRDPNDLALTTGVIAMSHSLGVTVVAEGIENVGQHDMLRERGCPLGQGFHLGHPLPPGEIERLFG
jgi:diguanylate cyclase (GGDEF)-like protein